MSRRVALVTDASIHLGPDLARELARRSHDLILGEPADGLVAELEALGAAVEAIDGVEDLSNPASIGSLVSAGIDRFGRLDSACVRTGKIEVGPTLDATMETFESQVAHNLAAVLHAIQAIVPPMIEQGSGQVVIVTSGTGARPAVRAPLYSATRAAANMLVRATALDIADQGITLNAVGTNYLDYPKFREATGADDPTVRATIERQIPMRRLGQPGEVAHFVAGLLDGKAMFQTGEFFPLSGGWNAA